MTLSISITAQRKTRRSADWHVCGGHTRKRYRFHWHRHGCCFPWRFQEFSSATVPVRALSGSYRFWHLSLAAVLLPCRSLDFKSLTRNLKRTEGKDELPCCRMQESFHVRLRLFSPAAPAGAWIH